MRDLDTYIDLAKINNRIPSNNKLAGLIGINWSSMSSLSRGHALPTDENMLKLAELAGIKPEEAMIDLNIWRAERDNKPKVKSFWQDLAKKIASIALSVVFVCLATNPLVNSRNKIETLPQIYSNNVYYVYK